MKQIGSLGNLKFVNEAPIDWPNDMAQCKDDEIGSYKMYNHVNLFDIYSRPLDRPIVIHEKQDDLGKSEKMNGNSGKAVACGSLKYWH